MDVSPPLTPVTTTPLPTKAPRQWPIVSVSTWLLCALFFGPFLVYPVGRVLWGALVQDGVFTPSLLLLPWQNTNVSESVRNSFVIGICTTLAASLIAFPLAYVSARLRFPGKNLLTGLLLVPLLLPPFVGAVGLKQMLGYQGIINTLMQGWGLIERPILWLDFAAPMVIAVSAFHLYPLIYLNLSAAWANIDPTLEEAAENQGADGWTIFRTVTLPLLLPGFMSGALIVFIFAFTDLGTPLVFNYDRVAAVRIYDARMVPSDPTGYVLAFWLTIVAAIVFWTSRRFLENNRIATVSRATGAARESQARGWQIPLIYGMFGCIIGLALLPHIGVVLASLANDWTNTLWPDWTLENYTRLLSSDSENAQLAVNSIKLSLICATASMSIDVIGGFALAYALVRGRVWGRGILDTIAMMPLALPGLILAFGLLMAFLDTPLDPLQYSPIPLLIISYAVRRFPYALRAVSSGLQQMSVTLEEASANLGATPWQTLWHVTRPLVTANLIAAGLLTFAFAVLEVSDSLILSSDSDTAPIAKAIYQLSLNVAGGTFMACALGVIGMLFLTVTFMLANRLLGKRLGSMFRL
jgi:iron(III) transport system permease protein